ncbi:hypothetical protein B0O99DRAFT_653747 [Bisporella sp. PMI_857]|nr:hypothetical protein B0O99DRAFT_653747 [Bisporella sp. PMI_857]
MGKSEGGNEWTGGFTTWLGDDGISDYKRMLSESVENFIKDFPEAQNAELFICGYSAGAIFAGCTRLPPGFPQFSPPHYILISYPVELNPLIGLYKTPSYFRSVAGLIQGHGWENLPVEFEGNEPEVAGVLTISGALEKFLFYGVWTGFLGSKDSRKILKQVAVAGAGHPWTGKAHCIVEEVDKWLQESQK